jgi:hypothetical protein
VVPLEAGCTAPPPGLQAQLHDFCASGDIDRLNMELTAFVSGHMHDIIQRDIGSPTYLAEAINMASSLMKSD